MVVSSHPLKFLGLKGLVVVSAKPLKAVQVRLLAGDLKTDSPDLFSPHVVKAFGAFLARPGEMKVPVS